MKHASAKDCESVTIIMSSLPCGNNLLYLNSKLFNVEHYLPTHFF